MGELPLDVVSIILLRCPLDLMWTCRLVCKAWNELIKSPKFRSDRDEPQAWSLAYNYTTKKKRNVNYVSTAWIYLYNPLRNERIRIDFPLAKVWKEDEPKRIDFLPSHENPSELYVVTLFEKKEKKENQNLKPMYCRWNPLTDFYAHRGEYTEEKEMYMERKRNRLNKVRLPREIEKDEDNHWVTFMEPSPIDDTLWLLTCCREIECLRIYKRTKQTPWELVGNMSEEKCKWISDAFTRNDLNWIPTEDYVLIWTAGDKKNKERAVLLYPREGRLMCKKVTNNWHGHEPRAISKCMWDSLRGPFYPRYVYEKSLLVDG